MSEKRAIIPANIGHLYSSLKKANTVIHLQNDTVNMFEKSTDVKLPLVMMCKCTISHYTIDILPTDVLNFHEIEKVLVFENYKSNSEKPKFLDDISKKTPSPIEFLEDTDRKISSPIEVLEDTGRKIPYLIEVLEDTGRKIPSPTEFLKDTGKKSPSPIEIFEDTGRKIFSPIEFP